MYGRIQGESRACIGLSSFSQNLDTGRVCRRLTRWAIQAKRCESIDLSQRVKPFYKNTALFAPGDPGCGGKSSQRLGAGPAPWESEVEFHLTSPGFSFRLPPRGATAHRDSPGFNARPMAGQKYHCPTLRIIALPGAARQFQNVLLAPSPWGDLGGTSGLALAPHPAAGVDRMKCVFGFQGTMNVFPVHPIAAGKGQKLSWF